TLALCGGEQDAVHRLYGRVALAQVLDDDGVHGRTVVVALNGKSGQLRDATRRLGRVSRRWTSTSIRARSCSSASAFPSPTVTVPTPHRRRAPRRSSSAAPSSSRL